MAGFSVPPEDEVADSGVFVPGGNPHAESYDVPEGSQAYANDEPVVRSADSNEVIVAGDSDDYVFSTSPVTPGDPSYVRISGTDFDEEDGYIALPVDTEHP